MVYKYLDFVSLQVDISQFSWEARREEFLGLFEV